MRYGAAAVLGVAVFCYGVPAGAQSELPSGTLKQDAASSGVENVVSTGFEAAHEPPAEDEKDATDLKVSAGGMQTGGNTRTLALTASAKFRRRSLNEMNAAVVGNSGRSATNSDDKLETTVENLQGRLRYDRYLSSPVALFLGASALHDKFQGLDLRLNIDPGVAYYVLDEKGHRLWPELGYDLQHDIRRQETLDEARANGDVLDDTATRHSARVFLGYENDLAQSVNFDTGIEFLKSLTDGDNWRLNWDAAFRANVSGNFSLAVTLSLKYDNNPLPGIRDTDLTSALSLVYQVL
jgi:putative salt-induced outer membrane protein